MREIEISASSLKEAIDKACKNLNANEKTLNYEVIQEGSKGFLGLIGKKDFIIKANKKDNSVQIATNFIKGILDNSSIEGDIDVKLEGNLLNIEITGKEAGDLIGRRGEALDSLQFLTGLVVNKEVEDHKKIFINIEGYRQRREESLKRFANKMARKAYKNRKTVRLEPMNPYERRIIHSVLQEDKYVRTYSEGDEPNRRVVIALKK